MNSPRETIYAALFAVVANAAPFVTTGRRAKLLNEMQPGTLPALFQSQVRETTAQTKGIPPKYTLHVDIILYATNPDPNLTASTQLNDLIDAVEAALAPSPATGVQTLGGLVSHCFISGETDIFEGNSGTCAGAVIPIQITTT
jgi:hypothetical protein